MKALITGGKGFIGSHLYEHLRRQGWEVECIDNLFHPCKKDIPFKFADIRYYTDIEKYVEWADVVFHLAAQIHVDKSIESPEETLDVNVKGTMNILEACKKFDKKMVFASSSEVYGTSQVDFMNENHPLDAQSPYAASKVAGDRLCKAYYDTFGTRAIILRNFNTFGEFQNDTSYGGVIAIFTRRALQGEDLYIFGSGEQRRDYMHIDDAVRGYELCFQNPDLEGQAINVGTGTTVTVNEIADLIIKITGSKSKIIRTDSRPGEVMRLCADITKAKDYGFVSKTDFEQDLTKYVNWYKNTYCGDGRDR